jgi:hypothetical protein
VAGKRIHLFSQLGVGQILNVHPDMEGSRRRRKGYFCF